MAETTPHKEVELRPRPWAERLKGTTIWLLAIIALAVVWLLGWVMVNTSKRQAARRAARDNPEIRAQATEGRVPAFLQRDPSAPEEVARIAPEPEPIVVPAFAERQSGPRRDREGPDTEEMARMSDIVPQGWRGTGGEAGSGGIAPPGAGREELLAALQRQAPVPAGSEPPSSEGSSSESIGAAAQPASRLPVLPRGSVVPVTMARTVQTDGGCYPSAIVRRPVYSRDGQLVIPSGSLLHGECASSMVFGARRLFVRWDRIDTPDGTRLDLTQALPTGALDGSLGAVGKLKTHFWRALRDAALISVVAAGAQLAQPEGSRTALGTTITDQQIVASAVAQELSRVAVEQLRRNLDRAQTIIVREGARFNVVLHRDLILGGGG